jgi:hypothetical protein
VTKCQPGCTCKRHKMKKCQPGCTCNRHSIGACESGCMCWRHNGVFCEPGCTCKRHSKPTCSEGCTCNKHSEFHRQKLGEIAKKSWSGISDESKRKRMAEVRSHRSECQPDCRCDRHKGRQYDGPSYSMLHKRVSQVRGKASTHRCTDCGGKAVEWSMKKGTDGTDPQAHYDPRCVVCHRRYDADSYRVPNKKNRSGGKN